MARIVGVDLPRNKKLLFALTYIYGIGPVASKKILSTAGIDPDKRTDDLTQSEINSLRDEIEKNYQVEGDLRRSMAMDIARLTAINCRRGMRHKRGLPCRGQRTKTNSRTRRGKKKGKKVS
ncbi:MAG: 30S ribosomal protein S13 [Cyanobacteria bacterium P01_H01_bin.74]